MEKLYYPLIRLNKRWWVLLPVVACVVVAFTACAVDRQQGSSSDEAALIVDEADSAVDGETAADETTTTSTAKKTSGKTPSGDASSSEPTLPLDDLEPGSPSGTTTAQSVDPESEPTATTTIGSETGGTQTNAPVTTTTKKAAVNLPFDYWD